MQFAAAPEYQVFPTPERPLKPYAAAVRAARETVPVVERFAPDVAVSDILTPAPALAAELCGGAGRHAHPARPPARRAGVPVVLDRRAAAAHARRGARSGAQRTGSSRIGLERGREEYNGARARLGLAPLPYVHTGISRSLALVATLPQLEYPRAWPAWLRVVGPLLWEPPGERVRAASRRRGRSS